MLAGTDGYTPPVCSHGQDASSRRRLRDLLERSDVFGRRRTGDRGSVLHAADRDKLVREAHILKLRNGEKLWAWGGPEDEKSEVEGVGVVLQGALDIQRADDKRSIDVLRRLVPGDEVGFSTIAGEPHTADVVAVGTTTVAVLPSGAIIPLLTTRVGFALRILAQMGHLIGKLTDEKLSWKTQSVEDRVCAWILAHVRPGDEARVRHEDIARFVGATRPRVSAALKHLEKRGVIRLGRGSLSRPLRSRSGP